MITTRRSLITGLATLLAAPAIVRASSIMPVKVWTEPRLVNVTAGSGTWGATIWGTDAWGARIAEHIMVSEDGEIRSEQVFRSIESITTNGKLHGSLTLRTTLDASPPECS